MGTVTGVLVGSWTGAVTGTVVGSFTGTVIGSFTGTVTGVLIGSCTGAFTGPVTGVLMGTVAGTLIGPVTGSLNGSIDLVTGSFGGLLDGSVAGSIGILNGAVTGDSTGSFEELQQFSKQPSDLHVEVEHFDAQEFNSVAFNVESTLLRHLLWASWQLVHLRHLEQVLIRRQSFEQTSVNTSTTLRTDLLQSLSELSTCSTNRFS
jgi:hypothetical protein